MRRAVREATTSMVSDSRPRFSQSARAFLIASRALARSLCSVLIERQVRGLRRLGVQALVPIGGVECPRLQDVGHMDGLVPAVELRFPGRVRAVAQHPQDAPGGPAGSVELTPSCLKTPDRTTWIEGVPRSPRSRSCTLASRWAGIAVDTSS